MAKKAPVANETDPLFLQKLQAKNAQGLVRPNITKNEIDYTFAVQTTTKNNVVITQSLNNDIGDIVTVYNTNGTINVTSVDQTVNDYTSVDSGVSQIIAGENIVINSTNGNGFGVVTISTIAEPVVIASKISNGTSNVNVYKNGAVTIGIGGNSNVITFDTNATTISGSLYVSNTIFANSFSPSQITLTGPLIVNTPYIEVGTINTLLDTFDATVYRSAKYTISSTNPYDSQVSEILVLQNNGISMLNTYGSLNTGANTLSFFTNISGTEVRLFAIGTTSNNLIRIEKTYITV